MNKFIRNYCITGSDIDIEYRINPNAIIALFQDCFANYCTSKELAAFDIVDNDMMWIISDFNAVFNHEKPFWSETIKVEVWISEITKLRLYADFILYDFNDVIFAKGNSCWNLVNPITKKFIPTDFLSSKFEICNEFILGPHKKINFEYINKQIAAYSHKINFTDLDFNRHVTNRKYLEFASAATPAQLSEQTMLQSLSVKFLRESFLNDVLTCKMYPALNQSDKYIYVMTRDNDNQEICIISKQLVDNRPHKSINDFILHRRNSII
jgi:acyl-CoA thioesterase FadM